jgi:hypothetical protein
MSLANTISTFELEPSTFTQSRCEFRLPTDQVILQNIRIANFGLSSSAAGCQLTYANSAGVYQVIRNIYLYHDNQVIAQVRGTDEWMSFKNLLSDNDANLNKNIWTRKNQQGYKLAEGGIECNDNAPSSTISTVANQPSLLDLSHVMDFLENVGYLNTNTMRKLRLVMEFNSLDPEELNHAPQIPASVAKGNPTTITFGSDAAALGFANGQQINVQGFDGDGWDAFNGDQVVSGVNGDDVEFAVNTSGYTGDAPTTMGGFEITDFRDAVSLTINRPYLLLDEIVKPDFNKFKMRPVAYTSVEQVVYPVSANAVSLDKRINTFNNKSLLRLLMVNRPSQEPEQLGLKKFRSAAMYNESFQFYINGEQMVPNKGIDSSGLKQSYLTHAWGAVINVPQGSNDIRNVLNKNELYVSSPTVSTQNTNLAGNLSYGGIRVDRNIDKFDMVYSREAYPNGQDADLNAWSVQQFDLAIYGEVAKSLQVGNDGSVTIVG